MIRSKTLFQFSALVGLVVACGGNVARETSNSTSGSGSTSSGGVASGGGSTTGSASTGTTNGGVGDKSIDSGAMCNAAPPPSPTPPLGCAEDKGSGWVSVPCTCELWLQNTTPAPFAARIHVNVVTPSDQVPNPSGTREVEVAFDDPDASWYATWTKQAGNGDAFAVTHEGGKTTVSVGEGGVTLMPVSLSGCTTRKAQAQVVGSATLSMKAVLDNGLPLSTMEHCNNPPPTHPPNP